MNPLQGKNKNIFIFIGILLVLFLVINIDNGVKKQEEIPQFQFIDFTIECNNEGESGSLQANFCAKQCLSVYGTGYYGTKCVNGTYKCLCGLV